MITLKKISQKVSILLYIHEVINLYFLSLNFVVAFLETNFKVNLYNFEELFIIYKYSTIQVKNVNYVKTVFCLSKAKINIYLLNF